MSLISFTIKFHIFCAGFQVAGLFINDAFSTHWWTTFGLFMFSVISVVFFASLETKDV